MRPGGLAGLITLLLLGVAIAAPPETPESKDIRRESIVGTADGKSMAILIGVQDYANVKKLTYCRADVRLLEKTLRETCHFDRIVTLLDDSPDVTQRPTMGNLFAQIRRWLVVANSGEYQRVLLYFSGHGARDDQNRLFFLPPDCDPHNLQLTALPQSYVQEQLDACTRVPVKLLVLDCCHAGAGRDASVDVGGTQYATAYAKAKGLLTLASCADDETSLEWPDRGQGVFTYWLCEGLRGQADGDCDGTVDSDELHRYVFAHVAETAATLGSDQQVVWRPSDDWRGVAALAVLCPTQPPAPSPSETRKPVTAVFTVREGDAEGPVIAGATVDLLWQPSDDADARRMGRGTTDAEGRVSLVLLLDGRQQSEGRWYSVLETPLGTKNVVLSTFPKSTTWNLYGPRGASGGPEPLSVATNSIGMKLVLIPAGEFRMGRGESVDALMKAFASEEPKPEYFQDELPQHQVRITRAFYLGQTEVTVGQFRQFVEATSYKTDAEKDGEGGWGYNETADKFEGPDPKYSWRFTGFAQDDLHPVVNVSWNDAVEFCLWLSRKEGKEYRLPTEAEWEYACRAGTIGRWWFGDDVEAVTRCGNIADASAKAKWSAEFSIGADDGHAFTAPVGSFRANPWNLYDMHGNVFEWCADWYREDYYATSPPEDPKGPSSGTYRVLRGGAWYSRSRITRVAVRGRLTPDCQYYYSGFRLATTP